MSGRGDTPYQMHLEVVELTPEPETRNPKTESLYPKPESLNPQPEFVNPKPLPRNHGRRLHQRFIRVRLHDDQGSASGFRV